VIIGGGVPNPVSGGGALTTYTVVRQLLDSGERVTVFVLHDPVYYDPAGADMGERIEHLERLGAHVVPIASRAAAAVDDAPRSLGARLRRNLAPAVGDLHPHVADAPQLAEAVAGSGADVAFAYHVEALAASTQLTIPRVAGVGDPPQLPVYYRWRDAMPSAWAVRQLPRVQRVMRAQPRLMAQLLEGCAAYGAFAAHHAEWFRAHGAPRCEYFRTPVPDLDGAPADRAASDRTRILLLGHLGSIVTIDGLRVFARALPEIERQLGPDRFSVDVVGGYQAPEGLDGLFAHPAVTAHGHTEDAGRWLAETDMLVVPTSIPLGIRVRIIAAFSAGTPIVAHQANALGIPELVDGENALLGGSAGELAAAVVRLASDEALADRLRRGARATYERYFMPGVAAAAIVARLREAA
jgi:glycosyltransferase involved in cell wall biosynthesis